MKMTRDSAGLAAEPVYKEAKIKFDNALMELSEVDPAYLDDQATFPCVP